jgi:hypothetical protein
MHINKKANSNFDVLYAWQISKVMHSLTKQFGDIGKWWLFDVEVD